MMERGGGETGVTEEGREDRRRKKCHSSGAHDQSNEMPPGDRLLAELFDDSVTKEAMKAGKVDRRGIVEKFCSVREPVSHGPGGR